MVTRVQKWGNSQGLRVSKEILEKAHIAVGDSVDCSNRRRSMKTFLAGFLLLAVAVFAMAGNERELLKDYRGGVVLPPELYRTYANLVSTFKNGKQEEIEKFCLPGKIKFTTAPRASGPEYGQDINLPFLNNGFDKSILNLRKDSDNEYLIRTGTTALWFSLSEDGKWKLAKYLDKPIQ